MSEKYDKMKMIRDEVAALEGGLAEHRRENNYLPVLRHPAKMRRKQGGLFAARQGVFSTSSLRLLMCRVLTCMLPTL
jgi:hypothetical protein